ncbi:MAG: hypothetical protein GY795_38685, partial [Desulfobacterales bacterium]|nr:hypothetical protein [Desulfobacterales bacterium]
SENRGNFNVSVGTPPDGAVIPFSEGPCFSVTGSFDVTGTFSDDSSSVSCGSCDAETYDILDGNSFSGEICLAEPGSTSVYTSINIKREADYEYAYAETCLKYGIQGLPDIVITNPPKGTVTYRSSGYAEGSVGDPGASVEVNGIPATVYDDGDYGRFEVSGLQFEPGENIITAVAQAGDLTESYSVAVIYEEPLRPVVTITEPADGATVTKAFITVSGTAVTNIPGRITASANGIPAVGTSGGFTAKYVPLTPGVSTLTAAASKSGTGTGTASVTVIYEPVMPVPFEQKLVPEDSETDDSFGYALAADGDWAVVGAPYDDDRGTDSGSAYIFMRDSSGRWHEQAKLVAGDGAKYDRFGRSVAVSGDCVVVGAEYSHNRGMSYSGSAHVFRRDASGLWHEEKKLTAGEIAEGDHFGNAVAVEGDYIIVGAKYDDETGSTSGAAYIFRREGSDWIQETRLVSEYEWWNSQFGYDVSISGDCAFVSACNINAAYLFRRSGSEWTNVTYFTEGYSYNDVFAHSLDIDGGYAIVGTDTADRAYIFDRSSGWRKQIELTLPPDSPDKAFGRSVAINGDCAVVGAAPGSAYIYRPDGSTWKQESELVPDDAADYFGRSVDLSRGDVIVGADEAVYIYPILTTDISAEPEAIKQGDPCTLTWTSTHADTCVIEPGIGTVGESGTVTVSPSETTTYVITARGLEKTVTAEVTVTVLPPPAVSISADPAVLSAAGGTTVLSWNSENADTCTIVPDIGVTVGTEGSAQVTLSGTASYVITATGSGGTVEKSVTVTVPPWPSVSISADMTELPSGGGNITLSWDSENAETCTIVPDIGVSVGLKDSVQVFVSEATSYIITAAGPGGDTVTDQVTVTVKPSVSISAEPSELPAEGGDITLTWQSESAVSCVIEPDIGVPVGTDGSEQITLSETATYVITAMSSNGDTATDQVTVVVKSPVISAGITASPVIIPPGETSTLKWVTDNADSCDIQPDTGQSVGLSGQADVMPSETTVYTLTASKDGISKSVTATVYVGDPDTYMYGDPTPAEQAHLEAVNRARANPAAEAARMGIDLNEGLPADTLSTDPVQPLAFNIQLLQASRYHSWHMIEEDYFGHYYPPDDPNCEKPEDRVSGAGYVFDSTAENLRIKISSESFDEAAGALEMHDKLFLDQDTQGRGHRINILASGYREIGAGLASGSYETFPFAMTVTCNFANSGVRDDSILLGVVYDDENGDGYTAGEGIGNADILIYGDDLSSEYQTKTASAGGYGIPLPDGDYRMEVLLPDGRGISRDITVSGLNIKEDVTAEECDILPPSVRLNADRRAVQSDMPVTLSWQAVHADSVSIDNSIGTVDDFGSEVVTPSETTVYMITAQGSGGTVTAEVTVYADEIPGIPTVDMISSSATVTQGGSATLTWTASGAETVYIDNGIGFVSPDTPVTVYPKHTATYTVTAVGPGGSASEKVTIRVTGSPAPLPEHSFGKPYEHLVPSDATVESYDPDRFALITGEIQDINGDPIAGVSVMILHHPEYGTAETDAGGTYSLPAEGGSPLTVNYTKEGYLSSQRQVKVGWNDIAIAETVQMIQEDSEPATRVIFDGSPDTVVVHRSTPADGRSVSMIFTGDNRAWYADKDGSKITELTTVYVKGTEYTTPESMPSVLPASSDFTYCAELAADGAERVQFEKPVIVLVENFLGFDVGDTVPSGYYDRDKGMWVPSGNGMIVRLMDTDGNGYADAADTDGDGAADETLPELTDSAAYPPDAEFMRVPVTHFTPYDFNWCSWKALWDMLMKLAESLEQRCEDCSKTTNSFVEERSRIFHEDIPVTGTGMTLHYTSSRTRG